MSATELFHKDGRSAGVYVCEGCRTVAPSKEAAEQCSNCRLYKCDKCGADCDKHWTRCKSCRDKDDAEKEAKRFADAEKLTSWDGWVYCEGTGDDGFSTSLQELLDECENEGVEIPDYVWACEANYFVKATVSDITAWLEGEAYADWDPSTLNGLDELKAALDKFNEANAEVCSYAPDYTRAVIIPKEAGDE